jgi:hypothetical protein
MTDINIQVKMREKDYLHQIMKTYIVFQLNIKCYTYSDREGLTRNLLCEYC